MSEQGEERHAVPPTPPPTGPRLRRLIDLAAGPPYRNALVVVAVAIAMASLFGASYSLVLGRVTPHHLPAGVVGDPARDPRLIGAFQRATRGALELHPFRSVAAAQVAINEQRIYAALVLGRGRPLLLVSSASGVSVARVLEQTAMRAGQYVSPPPVVRDLHPLPPADPQGLVGFYATLAATILGFVSVFQIATHAPQLLLGGWLAVIFVLAALGGLALALVTGPLIGALRGGFAEIWGALAAEIAAAALFCLLMRCLVGGWAIVPTWLLFVVFGNTSSGGTVAPPLLPPLYAFVGRYLPPGATVDILRRIVYFPHAQHIGPFLVQAGWLVCTLAALFVWVRFRGMRPGDR
ncbi:ABC transporter permease [Actinomadura scrupuli]|uniref:ABC transporter permease n=1 Tax=Actinomadura scrupuli TaxID=559629 RepID=UPI003D991097